MVFISSITLFTLVMNNNETNLTARQSIDVIEKMMRTNIERTERDTALPCLIWGYTTVLVGLLVYLLLPTMGLRAHYLWPAIPLVGLIISAVAYGRKSRQETSGYTIVGRFMKVLWAVLGLNCFLCSFLATQYVLTIVIILIGSGAVIMAFTLGFKSMKVTSILGLLLGYLLVFLDLGREEILVFVAAFLIMFVLPGHYLLHKERQSHGR